MIFGVQDTSYCPQIFCTHNVSYYSHLKTFIMHEATMQYPHPNNVQHRKQLYLHTLCYSVHTGLTLYTHLTRSHLRGTTRCLSSSIAPALWTIFCTLARAIRVHLQSLQRNTPLTLCTDRPVTGERVPSPPDSDASPHSLPSPGPHVHHKPPTPNPPPTSASQEASFTAKRPPWSGARPALPSVAFGRRRGRGSRERGRGRCGPALMQSRAAALAVGGRRPPPPPPAPAPALPARAQSELDLVPCSGYGALSGPGGFT